MPALMQWKGTPSLRREMDRLFESFFDASKVNASFKDGVLTVTLPKTVAARGTTIPISQA